jgi:hypothetical protein
VSVEDGNVIAISETSVRNNEEGFRAFRVATWSSEVQIVEFQRQEIRYKVATGEVLVDCTGSRLRAVSATYFNANLSEVAREAFDEPFEEDDESPLVEAVCARSNGGFSAVNWAYENLAQFADSAPRYVTSAALTPPELHVASFASDTTQDDCYERARRATTGMSSNFGGEVWERKGWSAYFGPVTVTILCNLQGNVVISVAKANYAVGNLQSYADEVARLMGLRGPTIESRPLRRFLNE